jgi:hypothetical protein
MFQLSHSKLRVVEAGTSPISKEEKILIFCWVLQVGVMEDEECMVRNCLKGLVQLNNTYILHFTVVPNVCSLWFVIIVFGYYFNICLSFQIFKTIVLLRKERLSIWKVCDRQYPRPLRQLRTMHSSSSITPTCKTQQKIRIFSSFDIGLVTNIKIISKNNYNKSKRTDIWNNSKV